MMIKLGKLEKIKDLRSVWPNEAADFTTWLAAEENLRNLGNELDLDLELTEKESSVGDFSVDIFAVETGSNRKVVIENQLESTDHDHLGKLITYASGKDAQVVVWIVKHAREEHSQAIEWLNQHTDSTVDFFLIELELWKIGDSVTAPHFNIIERPNNWAKTQKNTDELTGAKKQQLAFWQYFAETAFEKNDEFSKLFNRRKPLPQHWYNLAAGSSVYGIELTWHTGVKCIRAGAYIRDDKAMYHRFKERSEEFDKVAKPYSVQWREMKKDCRFFAERPGSAIDNRADWPIYVDWLKDIAVKTLHFLKDETT